MKVRTEGSRLTLLCTRGYVGVAAVVVCGRVLVAGVRQERKFCKQFHSHYLNANQKLNTIYRTDCPRYLLN